MTAPYRPAPCPSCDALRAEAAALLFAGSPQTSAVAGPTGLPALIDDATAERLLGLTHAPDGVAFLMTKMRRALVPADGARP